MYIINLLSSLPQNAPTTINRINKLLTTIKQILIVVHISLKTKIYLIKNNLLYYIKFTKFLTYYVSNKTFKTFNYLSFFIKLIIDQDTMDFFITLNHLKDKLMPKTSQHYTKILYYAYYLEIMLLLLLEPIMPFLLDNSSIDPVNWPTYIIKLFNLINILYKFSESFKELL